MIVPETAMDEQGDAPPLHHHIGSARQAATAEPITDSRRTQHTPDLDLGAGVAVLHAPHDGAALLWREDVARHVLSPASGERDGGGRRPSSQLGQQVLGRRHLELAALLDVELVDHAVLDLSLIHI